MATDHDFKIKNGARVSGEKLILGSSAFSADGNYVGLKTSAMTGSTEYMIISSPGDKHTYISAGSGRAVYIRGGGNNTSHQLIIDAAGASFAGNVTVSGSSTLGTISSGGITSTGLTVDYTGDRTGDAGILVTNDANDWGIKVLKDGGANYGILSQTDGENAIVVRNSAGVEKAQIQGDGDASFAGTISSGAITSSGTGTFNNYLYFTDDDIASVNTHVATLNNGGLILALDRDNEVANTDFRIRIDRSSGNSQLVLDASGNLDVEGNLSAGNGGNISMDGSANGQVEIKGSGYQGAIALDATAMRIYHNSGSRSLVLGTNETARMSISGAGAFNFHSNGLSNIGSLSTTGPLVLQVSSSDTAHQRVDTRDETGDQSRAHWYGVTATGGTSNFRHAWYDGGSYINVTAASNTVTFGGSLAATSRMQVGAYTSSDSSIIAQTGDIQLRIGSISVTHNPYLRLQGSNGTNGVYADIKLDTTNQKLVFNDPGTSSGSIGQSPMTLDNSGNLDVAGTISSGNITAGNSSTTASIRAHYNDGSYTQLEGYGLIMNRGSSYIRPTTDGDKTLYIGGADASLDWNGIHFRSVNGLALGGTNFIDGSRNLQNIGTISSGAITSSGSITAKSAVLTDDGSNSPLLKISADNSTPWAIQLYREDLSAGPLVYASNGSTFSWQGHMDIRSGFDLKMNTTTVIDSNRALQNVPSVNNTSDISILPAAGQDVLLFNAHNSESQLRLYNNRQDVSNTPISSIVSYNSTQVSKIQFYRGTGGSSGYINFQVKPQNGESLTDTFQIGDNNTVGYGVNVRAGGYRVGGTTVIDANRQIFAKTGTQVGEDGTYGAYGVLGFGGITNGYNKIFGHPGTSDGLFLAAATGRKVFIRSNGAGTDDLSLGFDDTYSGYKAIGFGSSSVNGRNKIFGHPTTSDGIFICSATGRNIYFRVNGGGANTFEMTSGGVFNVAGIGVLDQSRNLFNIANINATGDLSLDGGRAIFDTDTGTQPFQLNRIGIGTTHNQSLRMWVDDGSAVYESQQDETNRYGGHIFRSKHSSTAYTRLQITAGSTSEVLMYNNTGTATWQWNGDNGRQGINKTAPAYTLDVNGTINGTNLRIGTTEVIDSSRNLFAVNLVKFREHSASFYISPTNTNTLNGQYGVNSDTADMWINYRGYNDTFSNFRDFRIGDGKGTALVFVDGSEKKFEFQNGTYLDSSSADLRVNTPLNIATGAYEGLIVFGTEDAWHSGIRQHDDGDAELRIWHKHATRGRIHIATAYDGEPATLTRPTNGIMIYGANGDVAIGDFSASTPAVGARLHVKSSSDYQLRLDGAGTSWAGINFLDSGGNDNLWYNGTSSTFALGGGGSSSDSTKKLHVHGGMTVGSGYAATASGTNNLRVEGRIETGTYLAVPANSDYNKIRLYGNDGQYTIGMVSGQTLGGLNDWAMTFKFSNEDDRGFKWMDAGHGSGQGAMALTTNGKLTVAHSLRLGYGESDSTTPGVAYALDVSGHGQTTGRFYGIGGLLRANSRISTGQVAPIGHYSDGDQVFALDTSWTDAELQAYFNSTNVSWSADSTAPGGYAVYINGAVNVGGVYSSGFPFIPVDQDDVFYMECWIKNAGTSQTHYMGSNEFNENFGSLGGNPGSYGYWVMSNTNPGSSWTKVTGYIRGFDANNTGYFENGTKYWTPQALFNYGAGSGTRACYISGWKVIRVSHQGERTFDDDMTINSRLILNNTVTNTLTLTGNGAGISFSGGNNRIFFGGYRAMEGATNGTNLQIGETYSLITLQASNTTLKSGAKLYFNGTTNYGIGAGGHNLNSGYFDTLESGTSTDPLELVYYQGPGVNIGSGASKYLNASTLGATTSTTPSGPVTDGRYTAKGLQFGATNNGYESNSAQISAGEHQSNSLNFVGMAASASNRRMDFWVEGGAYFRGNVIATGNVTAYGSASDERLKTNIVKIENPIAKLQSVSGYTFDWNENAPEDKQGLTEYGVIAQEVEKAGLNELVFEYERPVNQTGGDDTSPEQWKAVHYEKFVPILIEAIKEQQQKIEKLEELIHKLMSEK